MARKHTGAEGASPTAHTLTLSNGRAVSLHMPDMYALVATDVAIPNQALEDILSLYNYGGLVGLEDEKEALAQHKRVTRARFELARLCMAEPLVLEGDAAPGDLTPRDLTSADLRAIQTFFLTGDIPGISTAKNNEPGSGAGDDRAGEAMEQ